MKKADPLLNHAIQTKQQKESAIKKKTDSIKTVGAAGTKAALNELEGGREIQESGQIMSVLASPLITISDTGRKTYRNNVAKQEAEKRIKKVNTTNKYRKRNIKNTAPIYVGNGMVVEAANERMRVVYRAVQSKSAIVFIGRPR